MSTGLQQVPVPLPVGCLSELRLWARAWLEQHPTGSDPDSVVLAMTEMVTNSVRYGAAPIQVELVGDAHLLLLRVSDGSSTLPGRSDQGAGAEGGRGLALIDAVTTRWGVWSRPDGGKTVWCEFAGRS
jgi:anti-sigma regulatory factor (Ser/Thr protein kinase)